MGKRIWTLTFNNSLQGETCSRLLRALREDLGARISDDDIEKGSTQVEFAESMKLKLEDIIIKCGPGSVRNATVDSRHDKTFALQHGVAMTTTKGHKFELSDIEPNDSVRITEFDHAVSMGECC